MSAPISVQEAFAELQAMPPADRFDLIAELLRNERPEMRRLGWTLAERTVKEHSVAEALANLKQPPSAERGLAAMRANLKGGGT